MPKDPHPFIPVPNVAEVQFLQMFMGQRIENTFYWLMDAPITADQLLHLCNVYIAGWNDHIAPVQSANVAYRGAIATDLTSQDAFSIEVAEAGNVGAMAGNALPGNCTLSIKRTTAHRGRSARGRIYFAGIPESQQVGNQVLTDYGNQVVEAFNALSDAVKTDFSVGEATEVVVSRRHDKAWLTTGVTYPVLGYSLADYNIDSQRRRLTGRGQ